MSNKQTFELKIPVDMYIDDNKVILLSNDESKAFIPINITCQGKDIEQATNFFWTIVKYRIEHEEERSNELNRWKPFQKGDWSQTGGRWIIIFGLQFYFRKGKNMKGGRYIPFTNLNISFFNYW